jgi:pectinesterase
VQPNAIVAKDGSGQYMTVTDDINSYPTNCQGRYVIYVKAGMYIEYITIDERKHNVECMMLPFTCWHLSLSG